MFVMPKSYWGVCGMLSYHIFFFKSLTRHEIQPYKIGYFTIHKLFKQYQLEWL